MYVLTANSEFAQMLSSMENCLQRLYLTEYSIARIGSLKTNNHPIDLRAPNGLECDLLVSNCIWIFLEYLVLNISIYKQKSQSIFQILQYANGFVSYQAAPHYFFAFGKKIPAHKHICTHSMLSL